MPQDLFAARGLQIADVLAFSLPEESKVKPGYGSFIVYLTASDGVVNSTFSGPMADVEATFNALFTELCTAVVVVDGNVFVYEHPAALQVSHPVQQEGGNFMLRLTPATGGQRALPLRFATEAEAFVARTALLAAGLKPAT